MKKNTLFGHLATKFSTSHENMATEALNYIINQSENAKNSFIKYVTQFDKDFPDSLSFQTQVVGPDNSIPDIVGFDKDGAKKLIIEAKFWAGLTKNQPVKYLAQLPIDELGILMFISPAQRFTTLWSELKRRCHQEKYVIMENHSNKENKEYRFARIEKTWILSLVSWRSILSYMRFDLEKMSEPSIVNDLEQLQGLCDRMDTEAFLPVDSEELNSNIGKRAYQFAKLVDEVTWKGESKKIFSIEGSKSSGGLDYYGRTIQIENAQIYFQYNTWNWANLRETPLWLELLSTSSNSEQKFEAALYTLKIENPPRLMKNKRGRYVIPLNIPIGAEENEIISSLIDQISEIAQYLKSSKF